MRPLKMLFALFTRRPANRLDGLDLERLDDGLEWHGGPPVRVSLSLRGAGEKQQITTCRP
jgi:hypothetical protein